MAFTTSRTLLQKIMKNDEVSWNEFYETYAPLIRLRGQDLHLNETERSELVQDVMFAFFKNRTTFRYDPGKGKFRNYLKTIATNCAFRILKRRTHDAPLEAAEQEFAYEEKLEKKWREEWEAHILEEALSLLREKMEPASCQAFNLYVMDGEKPSEVARALQISINSVYLAKSRGIAFLHEIFRDLQAKENYPCAITKTMK